METIRLSERLRAVAACVPPCDTVADVGTDHGYLPVWLLQSGAARQVYATDVHPAPLARAKQTAAAYGLTGRLRFELCDGLQFPGAEASRAVVLAGMGGETMRDILAAAPWTKQGVTLILQPQSKRELLADWLRQNGYALYDARLCRDGGRLYPVLCVSGGMAAATMESLLLRRQDPLFPAWLAEETARLRQALAGMARGETEKTMARCEQVRARLRALEDYEEQVRIW